ncbi:MAG: DUF4105 domain-containing protein [Prevotella sp.]|nr:DUF4105 domain-containing protein [Prevotella sp.]
MFLFLTFFPSLSAQAENTPSSSAEDSLLVSLITCGPGSEAYSIYGHTAIRLKNLNTGEDIAVNYGTFDMSKSHFVLRFILGLTDYTMSIQPFDEFCAIYAYEGRWVKEQRLNLTPDEKLRIAQALAENYRPENRVYRYNIFYDNCTTRARDMIVENMDRPVQYREPNGENLSFRQLIHSYTDDHPWTEFGNDLLLGLKADKPTTAAERQFLPIYLMNDINEAVVADSGRTARLLVDSMYHIVQVQPNSAQKSLFTPLFCIFALLAVVIALTMVEKFLVKRWFWWFDALLLLVLGLCGLILTAMIFSEHPTVSLNLQILLLNPLALVGCYAALRKNRTHWFWNFYLWCIFFLFIGQLAHFFLGYYQHYAVGLTLLALILLIRIQYLIKK